MEYTKDVFFRNWIILFKKFIKENKIIFSILILLSLLIVIDIALVNTFLELISTLY